MTRKDYRMIASTINSRVLITRDLGESKTLASLRFLVSDLSGQLAADNPRFDAAKFVEACGF